MFLFKKNIYKNLIFIICILLFLFSSFNKCLAQDINLPGYNPEGFESTIAGMLGITVTEPAVEQTTKGTLMETIANWAKKFKLDDITEQLKQASGKAFKNAVKRFTNQFAYDAATYLATGDKGQKPMFYTEGWEGLLKNAADNAAGSFLEELGKSGPTKFNLCQPSSNNVQVRINLGLVRYNQPSKPACTFSQMVKNWDQEIQSPNFLNRFQDMFNPWSNDVGIALSSQSQMLEAMNMKTYITLLERQEGQGAKPVKDSISGQNKSPWFSVRALHDKTFADSTAGYYEYTGTIADAIDIFLNTLLGKLIDKWLKEGLVTNFPDENYDWSKVDAGSFTSGIAGAKEKFRTLIEPNFKERGDYNILNELSICPNPQKAGPTNCVISDAFRQAINKQMTVGQALKENYLSGDGTFGFSSDGLEPAYNEGYPYRSLIVLRKYRIIPVGWEIAAQKIKDDNNMTGTRNLNDLIACYASNDEYAGYNDNGTIDWCEGLVDPNWVLKAPKNYCKKEGPGPEIITENITGEGAKSKRTITRDDGYCADEQTCIKENDDGSCFYGYCTEERQTWDFNTKTCDPVFNTCQTFRASTGKTVSYLENTLDYGACNAGVAGCKGYCNDINYNPAESQVSYGCTTADDNKFFMDRDAEQCNASAEGCHEFIRTKPGVGANLLKNSSFENIGLSLENLNITLANQAGNDGEAYEGKFSLRVNSNLTQNITVAPSDPPGYIIEGQSYALSLYAKNCGTTGRIELGPILVTPPIDDPASTTLNTLADTWLPFQLYYTFPEEMGAASNQVRFSIVGAGAGCLIDAVKLERGDTTTNYSDYRGAGLVYEKLLPSYLNTECTANPDSEICSKYVRTCSQAEVDCTLYTSTSNGFTVPGKTMMYDYCPAECVGYDIYLQSESTFDSSRQDYFIPKNAKKCGIQAAGCDEFTNLDKIGQGAEALEYYTYMRQCVKPDAPDSNCREFYTWEGSAETGYQLKVYSLQADNDNSPFAFEDSYLDIPCDASHYNLLTNPMCREFYNRAGGVSYKYYQYTVSCSDNCHPYRRTEVNILENINDAHTACMDECSGSNCASLCTNNNCADLSSNGQKTCVKPDNSAVFCKNGGLWNTQHQACLYNAIPGEGQLCSAAQAGCREFTGSTGANMRTILNDNFESGSAADWIREDGTTDARVDSTSLMVGGHSLRVEGNGYRTISKELGFLAQEGSSYSLSFIAQVAANSNISAAIASGTDPDTITWFDAGTTSGLGTEWQIYRLNLSELNRTTSPNERLLIRIEGSGIYYIDDIKLIEITDRYYLIKSQLNVPEACYNDIQGTYQGYDFNLGCDKYKDSDNKISYLHDFTQLCHESAVGCEIMIDTQNSTAPGQTTAAIASVTTPADQYRYVVYDENKRCNTADKGCRLLGEPYEYGNQVIFGDKFLKYNPDKFEEILCADINAGCEEWTTSDGLSYFMDPGENVCEWRQVKGDSSAGWRWQRKPVKKCDADGSGAINGSVENDICLTDKDCENGTCLLDENDYDCFTNNSKTFGYGGLSHLVNQPQENIGATDRHWAGICPAAVSGCTEYIDPISSFYGNMLFNPEFKNIDNVGAADDGWSENSQSVELNPRYVYRLARTGSGSVSLSNCTASAISILGEDNILTGGSLPVVNVVGNNTASTRFYINSQEIMTCQVNVSALSGYVELKPVVIDYIISNSVDKKSCNGIVNLEDGCVLFNERSINGGPYQGLVWDSDATINDGVGTAPQTGPGEVDANAIIKVTPDRTCESWLACRSFAKDQDDKNICYDIGLCNSLDEAGNCDSFIRQEPANQIPPNNIQGQFKNLSGYSKAGIENNTLKSDLYPLVAMKQTGEFGLVYNGGFEFYGNNYYPYGWTDLSGKAWVESHFLVINNPVSTQAEAIKYNPEGTSFLKMGSSFAAQSEYIDVINGTEYIVSANINTANLSKGTATVMIEYYDGENTPLGSSTVLRLGSGNGWTSMSDSFITDSSAAKIKVRLFAEGTAVTAAETAVGNFYFDDVAIRPGLETRLVNNEPEYAQQSCRLYPETDALACDYYEDSGNRQKGWWGYCLEYDRYPGNSDACLLWWPVDRVKNDGIDEGAGYNGRFPLYYCADRANLRGKVEVVHENVSAGCSGCLPDTNGASNFTRSEILAQMPSWQHQFLNKYNITSIRGSNRLPDMLYVKNYTYCQYIGEDHPYSEMAVFDNNGNLLNVYTKQCDSSHDGGSFTQDHRIRIEFRMPFCSEFYQVVTPMGQNKYYSGRVYTGSDYTFGCHDSLGNAISCEYNTDYYPFGSVVTPSPANNPYEWDSKTGNNDEKIQPLFFESPDKSFGKPYQPRAGHLLSSSTIKQIFAESYGNWRWGGGLCYDNWNTETLTGDEMGIACDVSDDCTDECVKRCVRTNPTLFIGHPCTRTDQCIDEMDGTCIPSATDPATGNCLGGCQDGMVCIPGSPLAEDVCITTRTCSSLSGTDYTDCVNSLTNCFVCPGNTQKRCSNGDTCSRNADCAGTCIKANPDLQSRYYPMDGFGWTVPTDLCPVNSATNQRDRTGNFCGIPPALSNIKANGEAASLTVANNQFVNLTFNSWVDGNQLPLVMYAVQWGDEESTVISGVEMSPRPDEKNPHSLYHLYDFWDLKFKDADSANITCTGSQCTVRTRVKIKDNWGWCNGGVTDSICSDEYSYVSGPMIIVTQN